MQCHEEDEIFETRDVKEYSDISLSENSEINQKETSENSQTIVGDNVAVDNACGVQLAASVKNGQKRKRPLRTATLKAKSYTLGRDYDEDEDSLVSYALNCVMCPANFSELIELETHVRSHVEVVHFSLVLKSKNPDTDNKSNFTDKDFETTKSSTKNHRKRGRRKKEDTTNDVLREVNTELDVDKTTDECAVEPAGIERTLDKNELTDVERNLTDKVKKREARKKQISKLNYVLVKNKTRGRPSHKLVCPECGEVIQSKLAMRLHYRTVHRKRGYNTKTTCDVCNESFASVKTLKDHLHEVHDLKMSAHNKIYKCPFCDQFFDRKSPLLLHKKNEHPGQTNYMCDDCGKKCHTPSELNMHRRMHTGEKPYECDQCSVTFRFPNSLKEHMRLHTGERPFQCDVCGATFARQCNKRRHMISHTGKFLHTCDYCGKGFNDVGPLKIHIRMHTGERPFQCDMCEMKFVTKAQMQCHKAKHTKIRAHLCQICGAAFLYSVDLRRHSKIHTGIRNYQCNECNAAFFRLDHLKRHQRSHASNSKRLANAQWKPRPTNKKQSVAPVNDQTHEQSIVPTVLDSEITAVYNVLTVQHSCNVCNATFMSENELQNHMMLHQNNVAYVIRDIVVGDTSGAECNSQLKEVNTQALHHPMPAEDTNNICTMCNVVVMEPGGLKDHLHTVHQMQ